MRGARRSDARRMRRAAAMLSATAPKSSEGVVNLNDASEEQLTLLPASARPRPRRSRRSGAAIRSVASTS